MGTLKWNHPENRLLGSVTADLAADNRFMQLLLAALELPKHENRSLVHATRILNGTAVMDVDGSRDMEAHYPYVGDEYALFFLSLKNFKKIKVVIRGVRLISVMISPTVLESHGVRPPRKCQWQWLGLCQWPEQGRHST